MSVIKILNTKNPPTSCSKLRCYTCLALDRNLNPVGSEIDLSLLKFLCPQIITNGKHAFVFMICWECQSMINMIKRFQARVIKAHATLRHAVLGNSFMVEGLSNLKTTAVVTLTIEPLPTPPMPKEQSTFRTIEVKIENDEDEENIGDYENLIEPFKIQPDSSGESTDTANEESDSVMFDDPLSTPLSKLPCPKQKKIYVKSELPPSTPVKDEIIPSPVKVNYLPRKVFINPPKEQVALRGYKTPVKVTVGVQKGNEDIPPVILKNKKELPILINSMKAVSVTNAGKKTVLLKKKYSDLKPVKDKAPDLTSVKQKDSESYLVSPKLTFEEIQRRVEDLAGATGFDDPEAKCTILDRPQLDAYLSKIREKYYFIYSKFKCENCAEKFVNKKNLDEHNKKHDIAYGSFVCPVCKQRFAVENERNVHYQMHFVLYTCIQCPFQSQNRIRLSDHVRRVHMISQFDCSKCDEIFKTHLELRRHKLKVHSEKSTCSECLKTFRDSNTLRVHLANTHRRESAECHVCKKVYRKAALRAHLIYVHGDTSNDNAYCVECETVFKNKKYYELHLKNSRKHNSLEKLGLKCDHCDKLFTSKHALKNHINELLMISTTYICDICKKEFKTKGHLKRHIYNQHDNKGKEKKYGKPRLCEICGKSFTNKKSLIEHMNKHLGLRPHKCQDCGNTFIYKAALFTHRRLVHKVKRKYEMNN